MTMLAIFTLNIHRFYPVYTHSSDCRTTNLFLQSFSPGDALPTSEQLTEYPVRPPIKNKHLHYQAKNVHKFKRIPQIIPESVCLHVH